MAQAKALAAKGSPDGLDDGVDAGWPAGGVCAGLEALRPQERKAALAYMARTYGKAHGEVQATASVRRSGRDFDVAIQVAHAGCVAERTWLPLGCIRAFTAWADDPVAARTGHPEMARRGDWSAVRDSSAGAIWGIFADHALAPALEAYERAVLDHEAAAVGGKPGLPGPVRGDMRFHLGQQVQWHHAAALAAARSLHENLGYLIRRLEREGPTAGFNSLGEAGRGAAELDRCLALLDQARKDREMADAILALELEGAGKAEG